MLTAFKAVLLTSQLFGGSPIVESDFARRTGQPIHGAEQSVLVLCYAPTELKWDNEDVDQELARHVAEHLAANGIQTVDPEAVQRWLKKNRNWKNAAEVGAAFGTDYVIYIDLKDYSLFEEHSADLYRGRADLVVSTFQVDKSRDGGSVIYNKELVSRFPREGAISVYQQSYDGFKKMYLGTLSSKIAEMFCRPEPSDEACLPFISPETQPTAAARGGIDAIVAGQNFAALAEEFNEALMQHRLDDALRLAKKGKEIQPENPVAEVMELKSRLIISDAVRRLAALAEIGTAAEPIGIDDSVADADNNFQLIGHVESPHDLIFMGRIERRKLLSKLENAIESVDETRILSEEQREKLQFAGRGDIHAFSQRIRRLAPSLRTTGDDAPHGDSFFKLLEGDARLGNVVLLHKELSAGLFGPGSRFGKAASGMLEQPPR